MNVTEVEYTDEEYEDYLNEVLPNVTIRYQCGECQTIYEDDEDAAEACCNDS